MENRRIISYALFILAVVLLLLFGLVGGEWLIGIISGLAFLLGGIIFYRRGK